MADRAAGPLWGSDATAPGPCLRRGGAPGVVSPASLAADGFGLLMEDFRFVLSDGQGGWSCFIACPPAPLIQCCGARSGGSWGNRG